MPSLSDLTRTFARIGLLSFGGPAAQIALMHRTLVDEKKWVTEQEYLSALSFCMLLPGPEAMQLATWSGWRLHGTVGGLIAGLLFVAPGALVVLALAATYAAFGQLPLVGALFTGVQAAVVVIVIEALLRVSRRALKSRAGYMLAVLAFAALFLFNLPFPVVILAAALYGWATTTATATDLPPPPRAAHTARTVALWLAIWLAPLGLLVLQGGLLADIGLFFSKLAMLTFGGAYAVLAWMAQEVVQTKGWLSLREMIDALGMAETTPGPLILVTEFVAYLAAHKQGGWPLGLAAAAVTLWMTFAPCFLWIFAGAPWLARLTAMPRLAGALSAIMAAVVGVIANLSLWFALHVFFAQVSTTRFGPLHLSLPDPASLNAGQTGIALLCGVLLLRMHWPLAAVLGIAALAGAAISLV